MFWKNTAWTWDNAAADDGCYLLAPDLTPESAPETDETDTEVSNCGLRPVSANYASYIRGLQASVNQSPTARVITDVIRDTQQLMVSIVRGKDGFGFTICSDCPVRVQAVDPGGPAHHAGLRQSDSVLQLNGVAVETWKCVDLARAIRGCPSQIVLVVWRGLPEVKSSCDWMLRPPAENTTIRKLHPHRPRNKDVHRRGQHSGIRSSLRVLRSLWREKTNVREEKEEGEEEEDVLDYSSHTTTLKGTSVTSSNGDNYIILSPVNPGLQIPYSVYHDKSATMEHLYQTLPSRGHNLPHEAQPELSQQSFTNHMSTVLPSSSSSTPPTGYHDYQNCTSVLSYLSCSGHETDVTLGPKSLIFPVFVQPLDLCSPDRTLLMSEVMVLHQSSVMPTKVTVLIYSDVLLLTKEDEAGRCNVLRSPLYLNTLHLREVSPHSLQIDFLQIAETCWHHLFSLEAFSIEQKFRVKLCLHDNIPPQFVFMDSSCRQKSSSPTPPSDSHRPPSPYSTISSFPLHFTSPCPYSSCTSPPAQTWFTQSDPASLLRSLSTHWDSNSLLWKERGGGTLPEDRREEDGKEQQQEESVSQISEKTNAVMEQDLLQSPKPKEEEAGGDEVDCCSPCSSPCRPGVLRRALSDGALLQEPQLDRFLSDGVIHPFNPPVTFDPAFSPGFAHRPTCTYTLTKQLAGEGSALHHMLLLKGTKEPEPKNQQLRYKSKSLPSVGEGLRWAESLEAVLTNQYGSALFHHFLKSEFSEKNVDFWLAVERFKRERPLRMTATKIYDDLTSSCDRKQVNVDSSIRETTNQNLHNSVGSSSFQLARDQFFSLMEIDRFLRSRLSAQLANESRPVCVAGNNDPAAVNQ